jgi:hypothetical protein
MAAERRDGLVVAGAAGAASMRPRPNGRGKLDQALRQRPRHELQ